MTTPTSAHSTPAQPGAGKHAPTPSAAQLDAADPLREYPARFIPSDDVLSYLDGNSLGRPVAATAARFADVVQHAWGDRLIRSWDEGWFELPLTLGDRIGSLTLGAAGGQTVVADSTTVMLYKLVRAAVDARPGRSEIVIDDDNFPTDRFVLEGIAKERGLTIRWIHVDKTRGATEAQVREVVTETTAVLVLSHVSYRSGYIADMRAITTAAHDVGALVLWDLCHSVGSVPMQLDEWGVDLAVGCTYKYLNGGPGSPAFGYVARALQTSIEQPIWGWMGASDVFGMVEKFTPADSMRRFISGTPSVLGMLAMQDMLDLIETAGMTAIREKSLALTDFALALVDELLLPHGVTVGTPRDHAERGSHVTISHPSFARVVAALWEQGTIPDFRNPSSIRIGLSPLSTTFAEVELGVFAIRDALLADVATTPDLATTPAVPTANPTATPTP
ncbi:kynureninase [Glaciihabitans sp. dw_435]|uniref:kynureninase n=1 Tax=Glaciihabitans sp. dw_435 TaxID=2720081 RepID=UPI001BD21214|nr:kynureninase [Glaciihabitans sp. dw_435]